MQSISLLRLPKQNTIDWLPWTIETYFLHFCRLRSSRSSCGKLGFILRRLPWFINCHHVFVWWNDLFCTHTKRETSLLSPLIRTPIDQNGAPLTLPHLTLVTFQKPRLLIASHCRLGFQSINLEGHKHSVYHM